MRERTFVTGFVGGERGESFLGRVFHIAVAEVFVHRHRRVVLGRKGLLLDDSPLFGGTTFPLSLVFLFLPILGRLGRREESISNYRGFGEAKSDTRIGLALPGLGVFSTV